MGEDDLQMSRVFVTIFKKISLHSVGVFQSVPKYIHPSRGYYILVSCISSSTFGVCLEHFISRMTAVHGKHREMEWRGERASLKFSKQNKKTSFFSFFSSSFFGLRFQYVGMSLKLTAPTKKSSLTGENWKRKEKKERVKKAREVPQASGRSKCLANRWSYCSSLWDFRNPSQKKRKKKNKMV